MSLFDLIQNIRKTWLRMRGESLLLDGDLTVDGNANIAGFTGPHSFDTLTVNTLTCGTGTFNEITTGIISGETGTFSNMAVSGTVQADTISNNPNISANLSITADNSLLLIPTGIIAIGLGGMQFFNAVSLYSPATLDYFDINTDEQLTFTGAFSDSFTCIFSRTGRTCTLHWQNIFGAASANEILTSGAIPERYRPYQDVNEVKWGSDNSANVYVTFVISTAGVITIGVGETQAAFTNSGTCSCWSSSITYITQ